MDFKELIGLFSEVEMCLSSAEKLCIAVLHFVTLTNVFLEGAFLLEELMAEHGSA